jgi:RNA polymerase sigma-70 factor, ECF subfamily
MHITTLILRCQAGEADAIQDLIREHQTAIFRLALSILDDPAEADEATQDAFLAALRSLESYRGNSSFTTWLYQITVNSCRTRLRKRQRKERMFHAIQSIFRLENEAAIHPEEVIIQQEANSVVWKAVSALSEKHRLPVILYYYDNLPVSEIAILLNLREGTVLSRLYTAREQLKARLSDVALSNNGFFMERTEKIERN